MAGCLKDPLLRRHGVLCCAVLRERPHGLPPEAGRRRRRSPELLPQDSASLHSNGYTSFKSIDEPKLELWQTLASKAKGNIHEDGLAHKFENLRKERPHPRSNTTTASSKDQAPNSRWSFENHWKARDAASRIRPEALSASVNQLSGKIKNALEVGLTIVDNKTSSIIEETKKIQIRRKPAGSS